MNPLWWIPIGIGILVGLILLLLATVLLTRTALCIAFDGTGITLRLRVLGIPVTLHPRKPKKNAAKKRAKKAKATPKKNARKKVKPSYTERLMHSAKELKLRDYIAILQTVLTDFIGKFRVEKLTLHVSVGGDDAQRVALTYGEINALVYPILGAIDAAKRLDRCDVCITPDFASEQFRAEGSAVFSVRLIRGITCILKILKNL